ncbi:hypothetical protein ZIOFF_057007 [Zingiber officinale]|uniref:Retrotransposon gag domain-containing protein n=1 Tax=Zingiber officinale TaxID=94328 RepID=A0A8J5FPN9_ZINOF|nr:hypothetical protein ZIOFF_057007 [Zingiber officinale]
MKVEFPRWENNDPIGWISRAEKYFRFHGTSDNAKVDLASINLEGDAIQWYDWLEACHGPPKWEEFKEELINRFGPSGYENVDGELAKIRQTSTLLEYQGRFERLSNRTRDWSEKQLLGTFIEGLRLDIRREVKMNQPRTMKATLSFARLQEEKINEEGRRNNKVIRENPSHYSTPRRLTKEEIKERMAKGLCWHCDEKWHRGHQCKQKRILMIEPIENSEEEDDFYEGETQDNINEVQDDSMAISRCQLKHTIKKGLKTSETTYDSGSTNNFLDSTLARRLKQKIERASTFDVKVADGRSLTSPGKCEGIKIILPNYELITDLFLLPLDGCDVVLGAQWLRTLGDIIWNFSQLTMRFQDQGKEVCIRGKRQDTITSISSYQAERLLKKDCSIFLMQLSIKKDHKGTSYTPPELETLLSKFSMIFAEPKGLPPSRSHDHRIPLIPGSAPANVRPYRYPYIQKEQTGSAAAAHNVVGAAGCTMVMANIGGTVVYSCNYDDNGIIAIMTAVAETQLHVKLIGFCNSGESMENALRACCKSIKIGKILIHREGDNGQQLVYHNLPMDIADRNVLLLDPILGTAKLCRFVFYELYSESLNYIFFTITGNSAVQAISLLLQKGVQESNIIFLNLISAPQGVHVVCKRFPRIKIVTSEIEFGLNEEFRVIPGMGEFGDRYFGTDDNEAIS